MNKQDMKTTGLLWVAAALLPISVHADSATVTVVYDQKRGELSPGTQAPSLEEMMNTIRSAGPTALTATLEYGQRVECMACVPLLADKLLSSSDAKVREMAAWWLRQRPFGYGAIAVKMRAVATDPSMDPVQRSRAAEALGEFLDVGGLPALEKAAMEDQSEDVRAAAVSALGRLNANEGMAVLAAAFEDASVSVRTAALDQVQRVNGFSDNDALLARLQDSDAGVRLRAVQLVGQRRTQGGEDPISSLLLNDKDVAVRQAAAWALGRLSSQSPALREARAQEKDQSVLDAIDIALQM